jgi:hypothetical protein
VCRFFRPRKVKPRIHAILIALESPSNFVWLQAANDAHQQVVQDNWRTALPLDNEILAIPGFKPEFVVLPVGVALHIQKKPREFISDEHQALGSCFQ